MVTTAPLSFLWLQPQNSGIQFLRGGPNGYASKLEDDISRAVNHLRSDLCTKAFRDAGLIPPSELLKKGVVIGPSDLLSNSSPENLTYMGITENGRQTASKVNQHVQPCCHGEGSPRIRPRHGRW
jgi:hypothetical protein